MSCLRIMPLIDGESMVEEENTINSGERPSTQREGSVIGKITIRKRSRKKTDGEKEEKRIQRWNNNADAWREIINNEKLVLAAKTREKLKKAKKIGIQKPVKYNESFGDIMIQSKTWPETNKKGTIRIYGQNVNGVSSYEDYSEWQLILETLHKQQVDIACLTEVNLDVTKPEVRYNLTEKAKRLDRSSNLIMAGSNTTTHDCVAKRGGLLTWTRGNWSGRIIKKGKDSIGRWTYITMAGKNNRKITIYTIYRVCEQKHSSGDCTIYMQQQNDLKIAQRKICDPREALLLDLTVQIQKNQNLGHDIIVIGDVNEDIESGKRINKFVLKNNMNNAIERLHDGKQPAIYDRGTKCLDLVAVSNSISPDSIIRCGYLPFYEGFFPTIEEFILM